MRSIYHLPQARLPRLTLESWWKDIDLPSMVMCKTRGGYGCGSFGFSDLPLQFLILQKKNCGHYLRCFKVPVCSLSCQTNFNWESLWAAPRSIPVHAVLISTFPHFVLPVALSGRWELRGSVEQSRGINWVSLSSQFWGCALWRCRGLGKQKWQNISQQLAGNAGLLKYVPPLTSQCSLLALQLAAFSFILTSHLLLIS